MQNLLPSLPNFPSLALPQFNLPILPSIPGFPALPRIPTLRLTDLLPTIPPAPVQLQRAQGDSVAITKFLALDHSRWGIYDQSNPPVKMLNTDSVKSLDYQHTWRIANYPMEQGAFQSYNKVQTPFEARVTILYGGSSNGRRTFLDQLETMAADTNLYTVITPDRSYVNVSIESFDYSRTASQGATLLAVDIKLVEIKLAPVQAFQNTAEPSGAGDVNGGNVQASVSVAHAPGVIQ